MTTARFLEMFALGSLGDLPDLETLETSVVRDLQDRVEAALDDALRLTEKEGAEAEDNAFEETEAET